MAVSIGDAGLFGDAVLGHLAQTPAVWIVLAVAGLLYAAAPRALPAVWVIVGYGVIVGVFGPILEVPDGASWLSPFAHVGQYPVDDVDAGAALVLAALAAAVVTTALTAFRRRDLVMTA